MFSSFLASRFLKPKRTFVSIITAISILGVALGVWLLVVVIAVFTGYGERIKKSILGFEPHLTVDGGGMIHNWPDVMEKVNSIDGVAWTTPLVRGQVVMDFEGARSFPQIQGILPPKDSELERMQSKIARAPDPAHPGDETKTVPQGEFFGDNDFYSAVIGDGLAESHKLEIGDTVLLYSQPDIMRMINTLDGSEKTEEQRRAGLDEIREMTAPQEVTVTGIFDSGHWQSYANVIFLHLETAQVLYGFDLEECHFVTVRTDDGFKADIYRDELIAMLPQHLLVRTWMENFRTLFDAVAAERQAMYLILFLVMIVAGFCIMSTMITITFQKRSEIGLLKALGAREGQVAAVFLMQGMLVGVIGVVVGLLMAQLTVYFRNDMAGWIGSTFGVEFFSSETQGVEGGLPAKQTVRDLVIISSGALIACTISSLVPAVIAASLQPAKALRNG